MGWTKLEKNQDYSFPDEKLKSFEKFEKESVTCEPIKGNDNLVLENSVGLFISKVIEKCEVNGDGDFVVPYSSISDLTKQYLFVKRNRFAKLEEHKNGHVHICKHCGSYNVSAERRPNGRIVCNDCGAQYSTSDRTTAP